MIRVSIRGAETRGPRVPINHSPPANTMTEGAIKMLRLYLTTTVALSMNLDACCVGPWRREPEWECDAKAGVGGRVWVSVRACFGTSTRPVGGCTYRFAESPRSNSMIGREINLRTQRQRSAVGGLLAVNIQRTKCCVRSVTCARS